ncbi:ABC transporter permease [Larkinella insperata]|uniref:ABC transporter permease n=1 Tax=Larkinella insperata TaxID=332158 RepID=A0ABW3QAL8_9BACT|nr:ABC transporter permease [Larkinella insperata]
MKTTEPPRWADRLLAWFCAPHLLEEIQGDLYERFLRNRRLFGLAYARQQYVWDVVRFMQPQFLTRKPNPFKQPNWTDMIRNYFTIAYRNLLQQKSYAFINVLGLALGLAACIVIFLVVRNELTYDRYHRKADRTYRVTVHGLDYNPSVSFAVAPAFRNDFPEAEQVSQYLYRGEGQVQVGRERYIEEGYAWADGQFPQIFDFEWLAGHPQTALQEPNTIVLTERIARKYFGDQEALGKVIRLDNQWNMRVTGVIKELPSNTHLTFNFLVSWETIRKEASTTNFWSINGGYTYVVLPEKVRPERITARFPAFLEKNWADQVKQDKGVLMLQPLREIHFDKRYLTQITMPRSKESIYGLAGVAVIIILTACINFVNLATAQAVRRSKEVGIRKTLGAYRRQLVGQVLGETTFLAGLAMVLALGAVWAFLPLSKPLLNIRIDAAQLTQPLVLVAIAGILLITILLAGLYPAFVQAGFQPTKALKARATNLTVGGLALRKGLVIMQFSITQVMIIGTLVVASQMDFFLNQDLGFDKEAIVSFPTGEKADVLRQKLQENPGVLQVSFASAGPAFNINFAPFSAPERGMTENDVTELKMVDENYIPMYDLEVLAGEPVVKMAEKDTVRNVVVNQTLIRRLGFQKESDAIGQSVRVAGQPVIIRGVVRDFQSESKHKKIRACVLTYEPKALWQASVKLRPSAVRKTLATIEHDWSALNPESIFTYEFTDEHIARLYTQEEKVYNAFRLFAGIAIVIGSLGLFGLVSLMAVQRTKEVGIRKVLGASVSSIVVLFSREFVWLLLIAFGIAAPLAWYTMNVWLREYAYHIQIGPAIFLVAILVTFAIAALTVSYQSIKAALVNPVKSLRSE